LYFSFEESPDQLVRNIRSVGINLDPFLKSGLLQIHSSRPSLQGLEMHLLIMHKLISQFQPKTVIVDPISSLTNIGSMGEVRDMLIRLIDLLKVSGINAIFTTLTQGTHIVNKDMALHAVSSLADIWIALDNEKQQGKRVRSLRVIKARGLGHETEAINFSITNKGIILDSGQ
jgi:circadian clock protein KaiC